jgi:hypothetical protein
LGLGFIVEGVKMMEANVVLAVSASALTFVLLSYERIPAMLVLLGVSVLTAGVSMWNMGVGYVTGFVLWHAYQRGWLKG